MKALSLMLHKELNVANSYVSLEAALPPVRLSDENLALDSISTAVLQRIQLNQPQTPDPQKLRYQGELF